MGNKLSLCMIVKNEEEVLGRCLEGVKGAVDEIIIVDTGSTDLTKEIARKYGANVFDFEWTDDFSEARNFSISKANGDYILWLDADDVITPESRARLLGLKKILEREKYDTVFCPYVILSDDGKEQLRYYRERILSKKSDPEFSGCVHECAEPKGKIFYSDFTVYHKKPENRKNRSENRNFHIYLKQIKKGYQLSPRDKFYFGRELFYEGLYTQAIATLKEFSEDEKGWDINKIEACKIIYKCYELKNLCDEGIDFLYKSFSFGEPRAEILCLIGWFFSKKQKFKEAIFWFESALRAKDHTEQGDFENPDYNSIIPLIELTYCNEKAGNRQKAIEYQKIAEEIAPDHPSVLINKQYFNGLRYR